MNTANAQMHTQVQTMHQQSIVVTTWTYNTFLAWKTSKTFQKKKKCNIIEFRALIITLL